MFVVPLLLLENRTQKENFELSWFLLLLCPAGLCTTVHVTTSMRENPDIGLGHHTARWPLLKTNSFWRPPLTTTSPVFVQSADVSRFSPNPTLIPWSRDPKAGRAPFQTSRCLRRWPGWLARCPSRLLALLHPLLEESTSQGNQTFNSSQFSIPTCSQLNFMLTNDSPEK